MFFDLPDMLAATDSLGDGIISPFRLAFWHNTSPAALIVLSGINAIKLFPDRKPGDTSGTYPHWVDINLTLLEQAGQPPAVARQERKPPAPAEGAAIGPAHLLEAALGLLAADTASGHVHQLQIKALHLQV